MGTGPPARDPRCRAQPRRRVPPGGRGNPRPPTAPARPAAPGKLRPPARYRRPGPSRRAGCGAGGGRGAGRTDPRPERLAGPRERHQRPGIPAVPRTGGGDRDRPWGTPRRQHFPPGEVAAVAALVPSAGRGHPGATSALPPVPGNPWVGGEAGVGVGGRWGGLQDVLCPPPRCPPPPCPRALSQLPRRAVSLERVTAQGTVPRAAGTWLRRKALSPVPCPQAPVPVPRSSSRGGPDAGSEHPNTRHLPDALSGR